MVQQAALMGRRVAPVDIGDNVWIAADVFVGPGVEIGELAVVGARSVVRPTRGAGHRPQQPRPRPRAPLDPSLTSRLSTPPIPTFRLSTTPTVVPGRKVRRGGVLLEGLAFDLDAVAAGAAKSNNQESYGQQKNSHQDKPGDIILFHRLCFVNLPEHR